jgi:hypothetical protein
MNAFQFGRFVGASLLKFAADDLVEGPLPQNLSAESNALTARYGSPTGRSMESFSGEAATQSYPVETLRPSPAGRTIYQNPPVAPTRAAPAQQPAPNLPEGQENFMHPQFRGAYKAMMNPDGSGIRGLRAHPMTPQATAPYPIRGAGRTGAIPTLPPKLILPKKEVTFSKVPQIP